ncbi:MAG TPA: chemotaxis protein CheB [Polyangiaceae bacterium]|nr:chemotaxis protein CheB [Polyangiaceae bacterium]
MIKRDVIVIGASAGGVGVLQKVLRDLPSTFGGSVFIVCHTAASAPHTLASVLATDCALPVEYAVDDTRLEPGTVKVAIPDLHLVFGGERVRLTRGPKQNRTRPAIDPLFRSAARSFGPRVVGVVLSGLLDDGAAGLLAVKRQHGITIVQDPADARYPDMPQNALAATKVDHCVPAAQIGTLLTRVSQGTPGQLERADVPRVLELETDSDGGKMVPMEEFGKPSGYSCPECSGVLWEIDDPALLRFRCRVGHVFSAEGLRKEHRILTEDTLWAAARALGESASFARRMAERYRKNDLTEAAEDQLRRAERDEEHAAKISGVLAETEG